MLASMSVDHTGEGVAHPSIRLDAIEFACLNQRSNDCPPVSAPITAREQRILAA